MFNIISSCSHEDAARYPPEAIESTWSGLCGKLASESADVLTLPQGQDAGKEDGPFHQS